jgi:hypothetical protein
MDQQSWPVFWSPRRRASGSAKGSVIAVPLNHPKLIRVASVETAAFIGYCKTYARGLGVATAKLAGVTCRICPPAMSRFDKRSQICHAYDGGADMLQSHSAGCW